MASSFAIDGIFSGLDTRGIVAQLIAIDRRPITMLKRQQAKEDARLKAITALKSQVSSLQTAVAALIDKNKINAKRATTDTASTSAAILVATAGAGAVNGTFKVTVDKLASATKRETVAPLGSVIDRTALLANAGFRLTPTVTKSDGSPATFSINGTTISVDGNTTLDDGAGNSLISKINTSGAGVTASLVADADGRANNRVQIVSAAGQTLQLGSLADSSNVLRLLSLDGAKVEGNTASSVTSGQATAGALSTSITINGVATPINQGDVQYTPAQNATFIVNAINANAANTVRAIDNGDGTFRLEQKTLGAQYGIDITAPGSGTGLTAGNTRNGTDKVVSTMSLGAAFVSEPLANSRVSGLSAVDGSFKINDVEIAYKATDSINTILNRINASGAKVTATYDSVKDRISLTATETGARTMTLSDVTGNFLSATGLLTATQTLGSNAEYHVDTINGGALLTSASNTISNIVPGVTLELKSAAPTTPVTVTIGQDTGTTVGTVKSFIDNVNGILESIEKQTKNDAKSKTSGALAADSGVIMIERQLRSLIASTATGLTGKYQNLASIGVSTGSVGSLVGSTTRLVLDESKLTAALNDNPAAVEQVLGAFTAALGAPTYTGGGAGRVVSTVSGTPTKQHENGTYYLKVTDAATNTVEARFVTADGRQTYKTSGTVTPGQDNSTLIPGVKLRIAGALTTGEEDQFSVTVTSRGVGIRLDDYVDSLLDSSNGFFKSREDVTEATSKQLADRITKMEDRLLEKEQRLFRRYAGLESALARIQSQNSGALAQLARLSSSSS